MGFVQRLCLPVLSWSLFLAIQHIDLVSPLASLLGVESPFQQLKIISAAIFIRLSLPLRRALKLPLILLIASTLYLLPLSLPVSLPAYPILYRAQSNSGLIIVGEHHSPQLSYRFLRADHSLLGGRWIGQAASVANELRWEGDGETKGLVGDSIFSTFVLQEGYVRLGLPWG